MNVLFLTLAKLRDLDDTMFYTDILKTFSDLGHNVYAICPLEKRDKRDDYIDRKDRIELFHANIGGDYFNTHIIKKGMTMMALEKRFTQVIKRHYNRVRFDIILYTTPPITFNNVVEYVKKRDHAMSYLMLKDIFPQNAVDMGMMSKTGPKGLIYRYFRHKEKKLYAVSDVIGCMSNANIRYVLKHNREISPDKVELSPNSIIVRDTSITDPAREAIRQKYDIPLDKRVFIYGGNLGKPQGIDFLVKCLKKAEGVDALFLIIGDGTDRYKLEQYISESKPDNVRLMTKLPKEDYDTLVSACDVGMIFLDHSFTIPNFSSRLLGYMQAKLPVLAVTDPHTDIGDVITEGGFGWWCESNNSDDFVRIVGKIIESDTIAKGEKAFRYLNDNYNVDDQVRSIIDRAGGQS